MVGDTTVIRLTWVAFLNVEFRNVLSEGLGCQRAEIQSLISLHFCITSFGMILMRHLLNVVVEKINVIAKRSHHSYGASDGLHMDTSAQVAE
jgi:hypothetical protein